ncbi:hypothetical protein M8C21_018300, partial [Ambrosia artemisiifolia]
MEDDPFDFESNILLATSSDVEPVECPTQIKILPFRNKVLLPGAIIRIQCTSPSSVKLVEEELWQREEKGLICILLVRDVTETMVVSSVVTQGELVS